MACFSSFRSGNGSVELEDLLQERPVEEIIELAAGDESTSFQTSVPLARYCGRLEILWRTAHTRQEGHVGIEPILQILEQLRLVAFYRPQIVAACLANLDGD